MAKIAVVSRLPLNDFLTHLELGGHTTVQTENFFKLQNFEIFHFLFDCSLQQRPSSNELKALGFALATKKKIAVTLRGPRIGVLFWPFIKAADMVTVEHKSHWLTLPAWVREKTLLEVFTLPLSLPKDLDEEILQSFKPYFIESRSLDFLLINTQTKKSISIPKSISLEHQQLLIEHSSGYTRFGDNLGTRPQKLDWDQLINHLNRLYRSMAL